MLSREELKRTLPRRIRPALAIQEKNTLILRRSDIIKSARSSLNPSSSDSSCTTWNFPGLYKDSNSPVSPEKLSKEVAVFSNVELLLDSTYITRGIRPLSTAAHPAPLDPHLNFDSPNFALSGVALEDMNMSL